MHTDGHSAARCSKNSSAFIGVHSWPPSKFRVTNACEISAKVFRLNNTMCVAALQANGLRHVSLGQRPRSKRIVFQALNGRHKTLSLVRAQTFAEIFNEVASRVPDLREIGNPNGIPPLAQDCEARATLGLVKDICSTPTGLRPRPSPASTTARARAHSPVINAIQSS
jgi:hypothetical protein